MANIDNEDPENKNKRRSKYIPDLAYFKFRPKDYWSPGTAEKKYNENSYPGVNLDTILYEDCITGMDKLPEGCIDLVIADPPFGIDFSGKDSLYNRNKDLVIESYREIDENYSEFTERWMNSMQRIMNSHASAYIFSGWNHLEEVLRSARKCGLTIVNHLIWKYQFGVFTKKKFVTSHYHILFLAKDPKKYYFNKMEHYPQDVWDIKRRYKKGEPKNATTLPLDVVKRCVEFSSKPGDLIFDPFMGMGTTAVAAKSLWRHYFGFELNGKVQTLIDQRLNDISTGQDYSSIEERIRDIHEAGRNKYPLAYEAYLKEKGEKIDVKS